MAKATLALLLACLAAVHAERSLYAVTEPLKTIPDVDYRGTFGPASNLALFVVDDSEVASLGASAESLGPYADDDALWVMECAAGVTKKECAGDAFQVLGSFRHGKAPFVLVVKNSWTPSSKGAMNIISVPSAGVSRVRDPFAAKVNATNGEPDPLIATFVDAIARTNLQNNVAGLSAIHTRLSPAAGAFEAQRLIEGRFNLLGVPFTSEVFRDGWSWNVCGELAGKTNPRKLVIAGAHYDCRAENINDANARAPGADDNGSGTSAVLEIARVLASYPRGFDFTIRFCLWSGEEQGLVGSRAYATKLRQQNADVLAYLNADMVGYKNPGPLQFAMMDRFVSPALTTQVNQISRTYLPTVPIGTTQGCCSDQQSFHENNFPAVSYFERTSSGGSNPHYHRSTDTPSTLDYELLTTIAKAMTAGLATLAQPVRS